MRHFRSKHFHISWVLAVLFAGAAIFYIEEKYKLSPVNLAPIIPPAGLITNPTPKNTETNNPPEKQPEKVMADIPKAFLLNVPFTPQAPTANWDELHNEACEEASMIMANAYFTNITDTNLKPEYVETEIAKLTDWEQATYGYYLDINAEETAHTLEQVYGLKTKILNGYTEEEIKLELLKNRLILVLVNGRQLGNPNFRQPGPPYHMLVIKGWNTQGLVTNDPGTRKGLNYSYTFATIYGAGGDWSHSLNAVDQGSKKAVVVWKE